MQRQDVAAVSCDLSVRPSSARQRQRGRCPADSLESPVLRPRSLLLPGPLPHGGPFLLCMDVYLSSAPVAISQFILLSRRQVEGRSMFFCSLWPAFVSG